MNNKYIKKETIFVIGFPWPYTYGGHRTIKICRELSKEYKVICISRPLFRYLDKLDKEPFSIYQSKGIVSIYDPMRLFLKIVRNIFNFQNKSNFIDSGLVNKINSNNKYPFLIKLLLKLILKIKYYLDSFIAIPDDHWPWFFSSYFLSKKLIEIHKPFLIISSFPFTSHVIAARLKKIYPNIKWIAEFPDLWTFNHFYPYGQIRKKIDLFMEKKVMEDCDKIITCQPSWKKVLQKIHQSRVQYIPHCIDLKLHTKIKNNKKTSETFVVRYVGTLYSQQTEYLEIFMKSFDLFIEYLINLEYKEKDLINKVKFEFIGTKFSTLENMIKNQKYNAYFKILPRVSYEKSLKLMHEAKLLLLPLYSQNQKVINVFSSKIIDYIGSQNQCLIVGEQCEDFRIITKQNYPLINTKEKSLKKLINVFNNCQKTKQELTIGDYINMEQFSIQTLSERFMSFKNNE